jgi:drug/metabolite transporter (DMT)-like permease
MENSGQGAAAPWRARSRTLLFASGVLFGLSAVLVKIACRDGGMSGAQATFIRFTVGLLAVGGLFRARPGTFRPVRKGLLASRGFFGGLSVLLYFLSISILPAGEATLLNNTFPIFAVLLSFVLLGERPTLHLGVALCIASVGVFLVVGGGEVRFRLGPGELFGLASAVSGGLAVTSIRALRVTDNAPTIFFAMAVGGLVVSLPLSFGAWPAAPVPWLAAVACGVVAFLAQLFMTQAYGTLSVGEAAVWQQLTPLASYAWALTIGESLTMTSLVGTLLGIAGIVYGAVLGHRPRPHADPALDEAAAGLAADKP